MWKKRRVEQEDKGDRKKTRKKRKRGEKKEFDNKRVRS